MKRSSTEEKARLRELLALMRSDSRMPLQSTQMDELGKLGRKYKYDPEFELDLFIGGLSSNPRRAHRRGPKRKPLEWWQK